MGRHLREALQVGDATDEGESVTLQGINDQERPRG